jgi:hypothetical protein
MIVRVQEFGESLTRYLARRQSQKRISAGRNMRDFLPCIQMKQQIATVAHDEIMGWLKPAIRCIVRSPGRRSARRAQLLLVALDFVTQSLIFGLELVNRSEVFRQSAPILLELLARFAGSPTMHLIRLGMRDMKKKSS